MAYTTGFAQIVVKPSFKGFQSESTRAVKSETRNVGTDAGRGIGRNLMSGAARGVQDNQAQLRRVADAAAKAVEKANRDVAGAQKQLDTANKAVERSALSAQKAMTQRENAAGALRVAEQKLAEVQKDGAAESARVIAAEEKVAAAKRRVADATDTAAVAQGRLTAAQAAAGRAQSSVAAATQAQATAVAAAAAATQAASTAATATASRTSAGRVLVGKIATQIRAGAGAVTASVTTALSGASAAGAAAGATAGSSFMGGLMRTAAPLTAMFGGGAILGAGWGRLTSIENAERKLTGLGHSAQTVQTAMDNALASVKGTAFGIGDAATVSASLIAAGVKPGEDLENTLRLVADSAEIAGVSLGEMGSIWGKVAAGDRIQAEEMNQLTDRGIPVLQMLAEAMGTNVEGVRELSREGKIGFADFRDAMEEGLGGAALSAGDSTSGTLRNVGAAISRLGATIIGPVFGRIAEGGRGLISVIDEGVIPAIEGLFGWVSQNSGWLAPLANAALVAGGAVGGFLLLGKAITGVAYAFGFLKAAVMAHPVLAVIGGIVAGAALLYQKHEGFRTFVTGVWERFGQVVGDVWENRIRPALSALGGYITDTLVPAVMSFWTGTAKPAFEAIGGAVSRAWTGFIQPALQGFWSIITNVVAPVVMWLWRNVVGPAFDGIAFGIRVAFNVVHLAFDLIVYAIRNTLAPAFTWVWEKVIQPIANKIADIFTNYVAPAVSSAVSTMSSVWASLQSTFAEPVNWIITHVYTGGIKRLFDKVAEAVGSEARLPAVGLIGAVPATAGAIRSNSVARGGTRLSAYAKGGLARKGWALVGEEGPELVDFRTPGRVYTAAQTQAALGVDWPGGPKGDNSGGVLGDVWNAVSGAASAAWDVISNPGAAFRKLIDRLMGGFQLGGMAGDIIGGTVRKLGSTVAGKFLDVLGLGAGSAGGPAPGVGALGGAGWQWQVAALKAAFPQARVTSTVRPGARTAGYGNLSNHARGRAIDIGGYNEMAVFNWLYRTYGARSLELLYSNPAAMGRNIYHGRHFQPNAVTIGNHRNHIHWAYDDGGWMMPGTGGYYNGTGKPEPVLTSAQWDTAHKALTQSVKGGLPEKVYLMDEQGGLVTTARVVVRDEMAMQGVWS